MKRIEVYADWQPAYMESPTPTDKKYFATLEEATPTIDKWRKTACTITVSEVEVVETYIWGKKKTARKSRQKDISTVMEIGGEGK